MAILSFFYFIIHCFFFNPPGYLNEASPRVGYYLCSLSSLVGAALLFLVGWNRRNPCSPVITATTAGTGGVGDGSLICSCAALTTTPVALQHDMQTPIMNNTLNRLPKSQSLHIPFNRQEHQTPSSTLSAGDGGRHHHAFHTGRIIPGFQRNSFYGCTPQHFREQQLIGRFITVK